MRKTFPVTFLATACSAPMVTDAGYDASMNVDAGGTDGGSDGGSDGGRCPPSRPLYEVSTDDAGVRCACEPDYFRQLEDGGYAVYELCDTDVGNPCPFGCGNPTETDGGRRRDADGGFVCFC